MRFLSGLIDGLFKVPNEFKELDGEFIGVKEVKGVIFPLPYWLDKWDPEFAETTLCFYFVEALFFYVDSWCLSLLGP